MEVSKILNSTLDDIVFENRNKSYGAYKLRKEYSRYVNRASVIVFVALIVIGLIPVVQGWIEGRLKAEKPKVVKIDYSKLAAPPPIENTPPPPPPPNMPPPPKAPHFTPPVIKEDDKVKEEEEPQKQEDLIKKPAGPTSDVGSGDISEAAPSDPNANKVVEDTKPQVFSFVEQPPEFPGGDAALTQWLNQHITYPQRAKDQNIEGVVYLQFVVDGNGNVSDIKPLKSPSSLLTDEAIRVVQKLPKFKPGRQNGQPVSVYFTLPVNFKLTDN